MSEPYYQDDAVTLHHGDCLNVLRDLPDASVDAVVTDPPYGLGFMGQKWDTYANETGRAKSAGAKFDHIGGNHNPTSAADSARTRRVESKRFGEWCDLWTVECLRVLKPGGHMLAFGGTRTWHRLAAAVEDAGFEIRDSIAWLYGSGFPKSLDVSKAIDKRPGVSRHAEFAAHLTERRTTAGLSRADVSERVAGTRTGACWNWEHHQFPEAKWWPALRDLLDMDEAKWGSVIAEADRVRTGRHLAGLATGASGVGGSGDGKDRHDAPATDDARTWAGWGTALKPAFEPIVVARKPLVGTVAGNVLAHGTGALNIDATRITGRERTDYGLAKSTRSQGSTYGAPSASADFDSSKGRWPANVTLDDTQAAALDQMSGQVGGSLRGDDGGTAIRVAMSGAPMSNRAGGHGDTGGASRFFPTFRYEAKAPTVERPTFWTHSCECEDAWPTTSRARATSATAPPCGCSTSKSGSSTTDAPCPKGCRSTTSTATSATTPPPTSSPSIASTTSASTRAASSAAASGGSPAASVASSSRSASTTGTSAVKAGRSAVGAAPATSHAWSATSVCGRCAAPARRESHATVKPLDLMRWLVRLVTPPGGTVLEPFAGSGTTAEACILEGFRCIAIEREADYLPLIVQRLSKPLQPGLGIDFGDGAA